jgi:hypothetical protein
MRIENELQLAEMIIQLDLLRDQLYEELQNNFGSRSQDFLRTVQNCQSQQSVSMHYSVENRRGISLALLEVMFITAKQKKQIG